MAPRPKYTRAVLQTLCEDYEEWKHEYHSFAAFLAAHGHQRSSVYHALQRHGMDTPASPPPWGVHLQIQRREACPPEVYCARNNIAERTFRQWAKKLGMPLRCTKPRAKREWWSTLLAGMPEHGLRQWCFQQSLPLHLVAQAYHRHLGMSDKDLMRLNRRYLGDATPTGDSRCLLWGWDNLVVLHEPLDPHPTQVDRTNPPTHLIGHGRAVTPIVLPLAQQLLRTKAA